MTFALEARGLQVPNRGRCCGADRGWKRGGEDEAGRVAAYRVAEHPARRDIASETAECLGERALDHVDAGHRALGLRLAAAARAVQADRVHLAGIGHGAIILGEITDAVDRCHIAVHGIKGLRSEERRVGTEYGSEW